jgi:hypothetical protein
VRVEFCRQGWVFGGERVHGDDEGAIQQGERGELRRGGEIFRAELQAASGSWLHAPKEEIASRARRS